MRDIMDPHAPVGLTTEEAARRLLEDGPNELPSAKPRTIFMIAADVLREPMFLLLVAAGVLYLLLGDPGEALLLLAFVFVIIGITLYQERKTENALQALKSLSSPRARVIRDGAELRVAGRDVARGDLAIIAEGDRVPADGQVLESLNLTVDESLLTGESAPVRKRDWDGHEEPRRPGGDDEPFVYSGTLVVQGQALIHVLQTGVRTEIGKIGKSLQTLQPEPTPLQRQTGRLVRNLAIVGIGLSLIVVVAYGLTRGDWLQGFLAGVALAMALLPEEFPVVLTIFLALGAWRISRKNVLARRMPAVETLGSATVLCVDKTGTLTMNQMSVGALCAEGESLVLEGTPPSELPESLHTLVEYSILASQVDPFDPMEVAFHRFGQRYLEATEHLHGDWGLVRQYPLSRGLLAMSQVWRSADGACVVAAKGAPEAIADLCHLDAAGREALAVQVARMAERGLRVLGVAQGDCPDLTAVPAEQHDFSFRLLGLIGLVDPVRPTVPQAIGECHAAGVRVIMITGDYPVTARNIAEQIGLRDPHQVVTGEELDAMSEDELRVRIRTANVFARVVPEQKLRLVQALQANGEIAAMTGDGVNDAPALKAADIGVAMGGRGTDVAREAAGLVLLDDDFSSIVAAIRLGRRIFDNLRKAMAYIFAIHVPIAGLSLIPVLLGWPLIIFPLQIVVMELIIDPACSTVFESEPEEKGTMARPPRDARESVFSRQAVIVSVAQGCSILLICLGVFLLAWRYYGAPQPGQPWVPATMAFVTLVIANLALIQANVSWSRSIIATLRSNNRPMWIVSGGAGLLLAALLLVPFLRGLFGLATLTPSDIAVCLGAGVVGVIWFEVLKFALARQPQARQA